MGSLLSFFSSKTSQKKSNYQVGICLHQDGLDAVLIKLSPFSFTFKTKTANQFNYQIIESIHIKFDTLSQVKLSGLISEDSQPSFNMLINAIKELKQTLKECLGDNFDWQNQNIRTAITVPQYFGLFKNMEFDAPQPNNEEIFNNLKYSLLEDKLELNLKDYLYDYCSLNNPEFNKTNPIYLFQFSIFKKRFVEKIFSAFDLHQFQVESVGIYELNKLGALKSLLKLEKSKTIGLIEVSQTQISLSYFHPNQGLLKISKPIWTTKNENNNEGQQIHQFMDELNQKGHLNFTRTLIIESGFSHLNEVITQVLGTLKNSNIQIFNLNDLTKSVKIKNQDLTPMHNIFQLNSL